jgi:hypothetical protein
MPLEYMTSGLSRPFCVVILVHFSICALFLDLFLYGFDGLVFVRLTESLMPSKVVDVAIPNRNYDPLLHKQVKGLRES